MEVTVKGRAADTGHLHNHVNGYLVEVIFFDKSVKSIDNFFFCAIYHVGPRLFSNFSYMIPKKKQIGQSVSRQTKGANAILL
jgi:hypothetical protein